MEDIFIALLSTCSFISAILIFFGFLAYLRFLRYKETMNLAEKGMVHPRYAGSNGKGSLRWGIAIAGLGIALCIGLYPIGFLSGADIFPLRMGPWMLAGLIPTFFGLALVAIYLVTRREGNGHFKEDAEPHALSDEFPDE